MRGHPATPSYFAFVFSTALMLLPLWPADQVHAQTSISDKEVHVLRSGEGFVIDVDMHPPVPPHKAWEVLTDYEHMSRFVPNLSSSQVLEHDGNHLKIKQAGSAHYGPFSMAFESVREVQLKPPHQIVVHGVGGSVKTMESTLDLEPEPGGTRLRYHAEVVPQDPLPPLLGPAAVRQQTAEQFSAMIEEMLKRP